MTRTGIQEATLEKIKQLNDWENGRVFTSLELKSVPGFTKNTLRALIEKGIVLIVENPPSDDPEYYVWSGKELK